MGGVEKGCRLERLLGGGVTSNFVVARLSAGVSPLFEETGSGMAAVGDGVAAQVVGNQFPGADFGQLRAAEGVDDQAPSHRKGQGGLGAPFLAKRWRPSRRKAMARNT